MTTAPVKKACDACHRRKVRCSGSLPCNNCGQSGLQCTYLSIPQKKGPKGSRAKVISEIRDTQQQSTPPEPRPAHSNEPGSFDFSSPPVSPSYSYTRNTALLSQQTIENCLDFYFTNMSTTAWILNQQRLRDLIKSQLASDVEVYCLTASLCAFVMVQPGMNLAVAPGSHYEGDPPQNRYGYANMLLDDTLRVRKCINYVEAPTLSSVQVSFFLFSCYFTLEKQNICWFHLREAATLAQLLSLHEESSYLVGDTLDNTYKRRIYWLLLVTERAYAMERHRPLSLHPSIELPAPTGPEEEDVITGTIYLISLFRCIDDEFMALWNKVKTECSTTWLSQLQQQLTDALPPVLATTESQIADVRITLHWLRIMVWQLSITNGCLSSSSSNTSMTFKYPIEVARDLLQDITGLSLHAMEVHGVGLIEKLFDVACTLTDVIACVPLESASAPNYQTPTDYLNQFLTLISQLRGGASRYLPLLLAKVSEHLPSMAPPLNPIPITIKQGYAGASDNIPTPTPPEGTQIHFFEGKASRGTNLSGPCTEWQAQVGQPRQPGLSERGLMFSDYSPSVQDSDVAMTPSSLGTPPASFLVKHAAQPILAPVPRSIPTGGGALKFEGYSA
ncbi:uncharacterized protein A1O9_13030 [Exophiala aquamarina CBS 119918]|uniref:Zn(2)-C6 fungal-type domain-containing protein n=1 Tax=Exophiala aquamarina CBS 119918 TaxID=1182545 RepID=A0A072NTF6_9EURO|nr:uncharacterized protein A1O9_13030 [Exophiala aquamarina CBS 119918]KEF50921.1 hypothetical protein A1O9_13030 [Exophiala aquamarina CBS 119918]